jgi:hypothetical protein
MMLRQNNIHCIASNTTLFPLTYDRNSVSWGFPYLKVHNMLSYNHVSFITVTSGFDHILGN